MTTWTRVPIDPSKGWETCFGCGQSNPIGLKLKAKRDGKTARTEFTPDKSHQDWSGIVHGDILSTLLDEAMDYAAIFSGLTCVAARMQIKLKRPAYIDELLIITEAVTESARKTLEAKATISLKDSTIIAESTATMFILAPMPSEPNNKQEKPKNNAQK
jgi:acyl-coenzyme A thioesterase PaaI-like protein